MKNNIKRDCKLKKMPVAIILVTIWMFFSIIAFTIRGLDMTRLNLNQTLLGTNLALFYYGMSFIILLFFIVFIVLFILRIKRTWKYFTYFIGLLIIDYVFNSVYNILFFDKLLPQTSIPINQGIFSIFATIFSFLGLLVYLLIWYLIYKNKDYFDKK